MADCPSWANEIACGLIKARRIEPLPQSGIVVYSDFESTDSIGSAARYEVFENIKDAVNFYACQVSSNRELLQARVAQIVADHGTESDGSEVAHVFGLLEEEGCLPPGWSFPYVWSLPRQEEEFVKELNPFEWLSEWDYLVEGFDPLTPYDAANLEHRLAVGFAIAMHNENAM